MFPLTCSGDWACCGQINQWKTCKISLKWVWVCQWKYFSLWEMFVEPKPDLWAVRGKLERRSSNDRLPPCSLTRPDEGAFVSVPPVYCSLGDTEQSRTCVFKTILNVFTLIWLLNWTELPPLHQTCQSLWLSAKLVMSKFGKRREDNGFVGCEENDSFHDTSSEFCSAIRWAALKSLLSRGMKENTHATTEGWQNQQRSDGFYRSLSFFFVAFRSF